MSILARKILNDGKPLAALPVARRSATVIGKEAPPNMTGANSNPGIGAIPGIFSAFLPTGGRVKEAQLVSKTAPNYPAMAKQSQIEGEVTVNAVIDITGKLTNMKVAVSYTHLHRRQEFQGQREGDRPQAGEGVQRHQGV